MRELEIELQSHGEPALVPPDSQAIALARESVRARPRDGPRCLVRVGGSVPVVASIVAQGNPAIVTGIATKDANAHSPNEKFPAEYLELGVEALARDLPAAGRA